MIFLLNLEIAYCCPPLGLNLFISSFRFNRPVVSLYRVVLPFAAILTFALILVSYVPRISDITIQADIAKARAVAAQVNAPPREAWILECVQEDRSNPLPCTKEDKLKWPNGQAALAAVPLDTPVVAADAGTGDDDDDALLKAMEGTGKKDGGAAGATPDGDDDDALLKAMMCGKGDAGAKPAAKAPDPDSDDELLKAMVGGKKDGG
jgi:C4-dicarboxylate transporter, DctM subunit